jgi:transposase
MWGPYEQSIRAHLPQAEEKMVFDKCHVAKHLSEAVDKVHRPGCRHCGRFSQSEVCIGPRPAEVFRDALG